MLYYTTGNLLESSAQALVNTVNCEGYMGKGLAFQFKQVYPLMFEDYKKYCRGKKMVIGSLHTFEEDGKLIINFPTKDKWRANSKIQYIDLGLDSLKDLIIERDIKSIAIPPLGSGNGGLIWSDVKQLIENKLLDVSEFCDIYIYEPSRSYTSKPNAEPKLSLSALVLMDMKKQLKPKLFSKLVLQKTAFFMNIFMNEEYFHFVRGNFGPYDHSIDVISNTIKEYQIYHGVDTDAAYHILYNKLVSQSVEEKLGKISPAIKNAAEFVNCFSDKHDIEGIATTLFLIYETPSLSQEEIVNRFVGWSEDKAKRFTKEEINNYISILSEKEIICETLTGYYVNNSIN